MEPKNRFFRYILFFVIHPAALYLLYTYDQVLYQKFHLYWEWVKANHTPILYEITKDRHWEFFKQFGSAWAGVLFAIFIYFYDQSKRKYILVLVIASILSGAGYAVIKQTVGKLRPVTTNGVITYLPFPQGWNQESNLSFPSGHSTCAFTLATFLAIIYPHLGRFFYSIAAMCAVSRVIVHAHYFFDVYAGGLLGYFIVRLTFYFYNRYTNRNEEEPYI